LPDLLRARRVNRAALAEAVSSAAVLAEERFA
jgi:hypothetical protein